MTSLPYRRMKSGKYELQWMSNAYILQATFKLISPPMARQSSRLSSICCLIWTIVLNVKERMSCVDKSGSRKL